jgi:hypothetical protein
MHGMTMECPCSECGGEAAFQGTAVFHIFRRGASGAIVATGMMKPRSWWFGQAGR